MTADLEYITNLARRTGAMLSSYFQNSNTHKRLKADRSVVTDADLTADKMITQALRADYPQDSLLSEELYPDFSQSKGEAVWIIDPIDGTTNFSLGLHFWGVLITRVVDGFPQITAQYFPYIDELYTAQAGQGAWLNGDPIHVKGPQPDDPATFFSCCGRTHRLYQVNIPYKPRILGSAAYSFCCVARGIAVLGFEATPKIWDIAGAWLLVQEAGGVFQSYDGNEPFPLQPEPDYIQRNFPSLAAANPEQIDWARKRILPR